jgi:hypothetical protein
MRPRYSRVNPARRNLAGPELRDSVDDRVEELFTEDWQNVLVLLTIGDATNRQILSRLGPKVFVSKSFTS